MCLFPTGFKSCNRWNYVFCVYRTHWRTHKWLAMKLQRFSSFKLSNKSVMQVKCVNYVYTNIWRCLFMPFHDIFVVFPVLLTSLLTNSCIALLWITEEVWLYPLFSDETIEAQKVENYFLNILSSIQHTLSWRLSIAATLNYWYNSFTQIWKWLSDSWDNYDKCDKNSCLEFEGFLSLTIKVTIFDLSIKVCTILANKILKQCLWKFNFTCKCWEIILVKEVFVQLNALFGQ